IIGTQAEQETVKKAGSRYFIDAVIDINQDNMTDILMRLIGMEAIYAQANNGAFGELKALVAAGLMSDDMIDPKLSGYAFRLTISGKTYVATAEPAHYGRTGKLSYWMDQTGAIKSADNGGKPITRSERPPLGSRYANSKLSLDRVSFALERSLTPEPRPAKSLAVIP